jgi:ABC-type transporter Mla maintaining outer membrane lipid asymmetry ATPase subunit MlaF
MLYEGKILVTGPAQEVLRAPDAPVREFVEMAGLVVPATGAFT